MKYIRSSCFCRSTLVVFFYISSNSWSIPSSDQLTDSTYTQKVEETAVSMLKLVAAVVLVAAIYVAETGAYEIVKNPKGYGGERLLRKS